MTREGAAAPACVQASSHLHFYSFTWLSVITSIFENAKTNGDLYSNLLWCHLTRFEFHLTPLKTHLKNICQNEELALGTFWRTGPPREGRAAEDRRHRGLGSEALLGLYAQRLSWRVYWLIALGTSPRVSSTFQQVLGPPSGLRLSGIPLHTGDTSRSSVPPPPTPIASEFYLF